MIAEIAPAVAASALVGPLETHRLHSRVYRSRRKSLQSISPTYRSGVQIAVFVSIVGLYLWSWRADKFGWRNMLPRGCGSDLELDNDPKI
jgi:hypothetical protein